MEIEIFKDTVDDFKANENIDCIGITFIDENVNEFKVYRYEKRKQDNADITKFVTANSENTDRKYFRIVPRKMLNYLKVAEDFIEENKMNGTIKNIMYDICCIAYEKKNQTRIRLSQLGIQNLNCGEKIIKSYFSIRRFLSEEDVLGEKQTFSEIEDIFQEIQKICKLSTNYVYTTTILSDALERQGYYPSLIGINQKKDKTEFKLYFELFSPDSFFSSIKKHSTMTIDYICDQYNIPKEKYYDVNKKFCENEYFLRGVAISNNYGEDYPIVLRMYYAPTYRFI